MDKNKNVNEYLLLVKPYRKQALDRVDALLNEKSPRVLLLFFLNYLEQSRRYIEPLFDFYLQLADKLQLLGFQEMAALYVKFSDEERKHSAYMKNDIVSVIQYANDKKLFSQELTISDFPYSHALDASVKKHHEMFGVFSRSDIPFSFLVLDCEVHNFFHAYSQKLFLNTFKSLGEDILNCFSINSHVSEEACVIFDNIESMFEKVLNENGLMIEVLSHTAKEALELHAEFLLSCYSVAKKFALNLEETV